MTKKLRKAVLPVAGLGTRFLPATKAIAKEMLPVVDKPLIQYWVELPFLASSVRPCRSATKIARWPFMATVLAWRCSPAPLPR